MIDGYWAKGGTSMRKLSVSVILVICSILIGCATKFQPANPEAFGRSWTLMGVNAENMAQIFYDPKTVTYSGSIVRFDIRAVDTLGYESLGVNELDCEKSMLRIVNTVTYDKNHRSVGPQPDSPWLNIPPKSIIDVNKSRFCK